MRLQHSYARFNGKPEYFGRFDDPGSHEEFVGYLARWLANGKQPLAREGEASP